MKRFDTVQEAREAFNKRFECGLVMTDNEIEEVLSMTDQDPLNEMWSRSQRNADSIKAATISYRGY